jgi:hypothetical protein
MTPPSIRPRNASHSTSRLPPPPPPDELVVSLGGAGDGGAAVVFVALTVMTPLSLLAFGSLVELSDRFRVCAPACVAVRFRST